MPTLVFPRNVMKRCYLDLCGASNWSAVLLQPIQSTKSYFISVYTPLCTIAEQCQCLSTSSTPCFHTIPLANPLNLIQYTSRPRTFSKRLAKCLSCFILICGCGTLEGVVILVYSFQSQGAADLKGHSRGRSRGRVQGVHTPPSWDDLRPLSN